MDTDSSYYSLDLNYNMIHHMKSLKVIIESRFIHMGLQRKINAASALFHKKQILALIFKNILSSLGFIMPSISKLTPGPS